MVALVAGVSTDVLLRFREISQRGPKMAEPHGAELSLSNAATAHLDSLVYSPTPPLVPQTIGRRHVRRRVDRARVRVHASPAQLHFGSGLCVSDAAHHGYRQLLLLQSPRNCAFDLALRRCVLVAGVQKAVARCSIPSRSMHLNGLANLGNYSRGPHPRTPVRRSDLPALPIEDPLAEAARKTYG